MKNNKEKPIIMWNPDANTPQQEFQQLSQEQCKQIKEVFEAQYGKDQRSRTNKQWHNLVNKFGLPIVVLQEKMSEEEVIKRMNETASDKFKRMVNEKIAKAKLN